MLKLFLLVALFSIGTMLQGSHPRDKAQQLPTKEEFPPYFTVEQKAFFKENGYLGPLPFFSQQDAETLASEIERQIAINPLLKQRRPKLKDDSIQRSKENSDNNPPWPLGTPAYWSKTMHILIPEVAAIGRSEKLLCFVKDLLGPDILLWGAQLVKKPPKETHRWHVDVEHIAWEGVTFWLPLYGVSSKSTIKFIPGSHQFNFIPQTFTSQIDLEDDEALLNVVRETYPDAKIVSMHIAPGEFVLFAGKTWHNTINRSNVTRAALIFQYCRPDARVRIPLNFEIPDCLGSGSALGFESCR